MRSESPVSIVIIDDDGDVRELLQWLFTNDNRFVLRGSVADVADGVMLVDSAQPDVIVLDLRLDGLDGLSAIPQLRERCPDASIVAYSAFPDPYTFLEVLERGADAFLNKAAAWSELLPTITSLPKRQSSVA